MSVTDINTIDYMGVDEENTVFCLGISDHLDWSDHLEHEKYLKNKVLSYLENINSEEIYNRFPESKNLKKKILIIGKYSLDSMAKNIYKHLRKITLKKNVDLEFEIYKS